MLLCEERLIGAISAEDLLVAGTGSLSSYTTVSPFAFETVRLAETGSTRAAVRSALGTLAAALLAVGGGLAVGGVRYPSSS